MKKQRVLFAAVIMLLLFVGWTIAVSVIDVQAIGPRDSTVGFATINARFHKMTGVHMLVYTVTDWLSLVPVGIVAWFAGVGLVQLVRRKSIWKVDRQILILGGFYLVVAAVYLLFEVVVINDRPILIEGRLEASYPSSTTMLVLCVIPTAILRLYNCMRHKRCGCEVHSDCVRRVYGRWQNDFRCPLAHRYYRRCASECRFGYAVCLGQRFEKKI